MSTNPAIWAASIVTLIVYSYLFKENELYFALERMYVGVAAGYTMVMGYKNVISKVWEPMKSKGQWWTILPAIAGLMLFTQFGPAEYRWLRRIPLSIVVGVGAAITMRTTLTTELIAQARATMMKLDSVDNIIIMVGTVAVLSYFYFTVKRSKVLNAGSGLGKWFIMLTFGAAFGNGVMGRISLLLTRLFLIFRDWIPVIKT